MGGGIAEEVAPRSQWLRAALLAVIALCTYLHLPLTVGGQLLVPSFPTVALAPLLFLTVRRNLTTADLVFVPTIALVMLLSIALSPGYEYIQEKFLALVQFAMALAVAVMVVRLMQTISRELLESTLLALWCLILAGAILEVLDVIREASDSFRAWAYGGTYTLYGASMRDMDLVGWSRPKFFSVEPSHVTKMFIAAINAWLLVKVTWGKSAVVAIATLAMAVIMGSPMLLVSVAITLVILAWNQRVRLGARVSMVFAVVLIGGLIGAQYGGSTLSSIGDRVASIGDARNPSRDVSSEQQRVVFPYLTLIDTWSRAPVFGVGVGGTEVVIEYNTLPVDRPLDALGNNALAEVGIFLGIVGGAWFIYLVLKQARQTGVRRFGLMLVIAALFSQLMGGLVGLQYWGFIALLWGALAVADSRQTEQ